MMTSAPSLPSHLRPGGARRTHLSSRLTVLVSLVVLMVVGEWSWAAVKVVTATGEVVEGETVTFAAGGGVVLSTSTGERRLGPEQLVVVQFAPAVAAGDFRPQVFLTTGEVVSGTVRELSADSATVHSRLLGDLSLARGEVGAMLFVEGVSPGDLLASPVGLVVLRNGDRLQGRVESIHGGVATLGTDLGQLDVSLDRITFIKMAEFPPSWPKVEQPSVALVLTDGERLLGEVLGEADGKLRFRRLPPVARAAGASGAPPGAAEAAKPAESLDVARDPERAEGLAFPTSSLREVRYLGRGVVYLSDLDPARVEEKPFFSYPLPWQRDRSVGNGRLTLRGQAFDKGLGVHARSRLTYALDGAYARFHALIGVDDEARGKGNCVFEVWADGKPLFASGAVTGRDAPKPVDLDVTGARQLVLLVDFGEGGDVGDRGDWADAYLVTAEALKAAQSQGKGTP